MFFSIPVIVIDKEEIICENFEAKLFFSGTTEAKRFLEKRSETYEAKFFLWFRETEAKRSETVSVSLRSETFFKAKLGHPSTERDGGKGERFIRFV